MPVSILTFVVMSARENPDERAQRIRQVQNIEVVFGDPSTFKLGAHSNSEIFPEDIRAEATDRERVVAALDGIEKAMSAYPEGFVSKLIRAVFICGVVHAGNARASGMIGKEWIVVAAPRDRSLADVREMSELTFHHELSSAVLRQPGFRERWIKFWPKDRPELSEYDQVAREAGNANPDPSTGFLSAYATTNPENDFNLYAERYFASRSELRQLASKTPAVSEKLQLLERMYSDFDPRMKAIFSE